MKNSTTTRWVVSLVLAGTVVLSLTYLKPASSKAANPNTPAAAMLAAIAIYNSETTYIQADLARSQRGFQGYEVTTFRQNRRLVKAIKHGGIEGGTVLIETDGETWIEFDVVTESDRALVRIQSTGPFGLTFSINGTLIAEATQNAAGTWIVTNHDLALPHQVPASLERLEVIGVDANLNAHFGTWGVFASHVSETRSDTGGTPQGGCTPPTPSDTQTCGCMNFICTDTDGGCGWLFIDCSCADLMPIWVVPEAGGPAYTNVPCGQWIAVDGYRTGGSLHKLRDGTCHIISCCLSSDGQTYTQGVKSCCKRWLWWVGQCLPWVVPDDEFGTPCCSPPANPGLPVAPLPVP